MHSVKVIRSLRVFHHAPQIIFTWLFRRRCSQHRRRCSQDSRRCSQDSRRCSQHRRRYDPDCLVDCLVVDCQLDSRHNATAMTPHPTLAGTTRQSAQCQYYDPASHTCRYNSTVDAMSALSPRIPHLQVQLDSRHNVSTLTPHPTLTGTTRQSTQCQRYDPASHTCRFQLFSWAYLTVHGI